MLVDLASEGALVEPRGRPLIHCQLFGTQFIRTVMSVGNELVQYQAAHGPDHIAFIRIRPSRDPKSRTGPLLDANGNAPLRNLRRVHSVTSTEIQGALEYMQSQQWLSPLVIGRHADPIDGGAAFDWHEHVTAQINPECSKDLSRYLYGKFGRGRVWISSEEEPGVPRDLVRSGCYAAAKLANRGYDDISDEHLLEFIAQSHRLRRIEVAGPIRAARDAKRERGLQQAGVSPARGPEAEIAKILADRDDMLSDRGVDILSDGVDADAILSATTNGDVEPAPPANREAAQEVPRSARLLRCHFAYVGLTLRWVALVSDYAGFEDLRSRYDLGLDIAEAKALAARAAHLLSSNPVIPESTKDESLDFESLVEWGPLPYEGGVSGGSTAGTGRPTAEPQRDRGPKAASSDETAGSIPAAAGAGRPTAEPQRDRGPKAASSDETAGSTPAAAGAGRPYPITPENESSGPAELNSIECRECSDMSRFGLGGLTLELTVQSDHGRATATLRVGLPAPSCSNGGSARIAG